MVTISVNHFHTQNSRYTFLFCCCNNCTDSTSQASKPPYRHIQCMNEWDSIYFNFNWILLSSLYFIIYSHNNMKIFGFVFEDYMTSHPTILNAIYNKMIKQLYTTGRCHRLCKHLNTQKQLHIYCVWRESRRDIQS